MNNKNANLTPDAAAWLEDEFNPIVPKLVNLLCVLKDHLYINPLTKELRDAGVYSYSLDTKVLVATPVMDRHWLVCHEDRVALHGSDGTWNSMLNILTITGATASVVPANAGAISGDTIAILRKHTKHLAEQLDTIERELTALREELPLCARGPLKNLNNAKA